MKIAVRLSNWIGDVVMNLPALEILRQNYPEAEIVAVARPWVRSLLDFRPDLIDRVLPFDDSAGKIGPREFLRFGKQLRGESFDQIFVFTNHFKGALLARLSGIPRRCGFGTPETRFFLNHRLERKTLPRGGRHQSHNYLDLLDSAGLAMTDRPAPRLNPIPSLNETLTKKFLPESVEPLLAVHAGAAFGTAKRWIPERYGKICAHFLKRYGGRVILLGVASEKDTNEQVAQHAEDDRLINLCCQTSLKQSIALISRARAFISNDSGLMHVAAAFNIPQIAIFGPTDLSATFPDNPHAIPLRHPVHCSPCFQRHCPIGHDCMLGVDTTRVKQALERVMGTPPP